MQNIRDKSHAASRREARRREAVRLRGAGLSLREIGSTLNVTAQTIHNDLQASFYQSQTGNVAPLPASNGHDTSAALRLLGLPTSPSAGQDWNALLSEAVGVLSARALSGSVSAAATLAKLAIDQRQKQAAECVDHVPREEVTEAIEGVVELFVSEFEGPFVRACGRVGVFGVDLHVTDSLERVGEHMRRLGEEAEQEAVPA